MIFGINRAIRPAGRLQRFPIMSRQPKFFKTPDGALDDLKFEVCRAIETAIVRRQLTQYQAAIYMGTSQANVSRVGNKKFDQLTMTQLFNYLARIYPDFRFMISVDRNWG